MNLPVVIAQSTTEPISVVEAASNMRLAGADDSPPNLFPPLVPQLERLIRVARKHCERELETMLVRTTLQVAQATWACIELPWGPVRAVNSVNYLDVDGVDTVLAADQYRLSTYHRRTLLLPAYGVSFPSARSDLDSIRVRYEVGYPSDDSPPQAAPDTAVQAMHLLIGHWFDNRIAVDEDNLVELPLGVRALLFPDRVLGV